MSAHVPLMIETMVFHNSEDFPSEGNPASYVQVDGSNNMSSAQSG